ncbi:MULTISPECIES: 5-oxoprolinase subunit PxpA [unclassified Polaribacter]|uniref:5-oxoprolinase subunit PxpA n=1 Tax=unclassified Polaribacter TaxID=196858 RepID=UPI0011BE17CA|nr:MULTISPECIES: 5-oxoprolinase subunit PxpA [unclassified Polaribacter]TXD50920.1 5-oxoprolinase subunit PxpA [Polaribacter sp. IC063]TXD62287.1 5-oxoprolinase subunit PxpA [Polaribacter sp. IC066]
MKIDINCDVGEGIENEHLLMPHISSCSIACGGHFGTAITIDKTIQLAKEHQLKIGAHPSFPDKENFGRKLMDISDDDLSNSIQNQLDLFLKRLFFFDEKLHHIKPHGALYNAIAVDEKLANLFIQIIKKYMKDVYLYVPYNSVIELVALKNKINIKYEAFADRNYHDDLTLVSRKNENALITDKKQVFYHVLNMIKTGKVTTVSTSKKVLKADTFCFHGDTENAIEIVKYVSENLKKEGFIFE